MKNRECPSPAVYLIRDTDCHLLLGGQTFTALSDLNTVAGSSEKSEVSTVKLMFIETYLV